MRRIIQLALTDFKVIFRDTSLRSFFFLPIILFVVIIWILPHLMDRYDFLVSYLSLFIVIAVIENTQMFSFISSMVLIDEKENDIAKVYGIVPLSKSTYLISKFIIPYLFTVVLNMVMLRFQLFFEISRGASVLISLLAAMLVPVYALSINSIVKNRIQGLVYIKAFNMLVLLPIVAFFIPEKYKYFFGIFPTHWIFQSIEKVTQELSYTLVMGVGFVIFISLLWFISRVFIRRHFV